MKLVNRVSTFFLGALAAALVGYSAVIYYLISNYLHRQFDADLHGALDLLAASVEVEPDDAKWHPAEHGIDLSQPAFDEVSWIVCNETGQMVDRSPRVDRKNQSFAPLLEYSSQEHSSRSQPTEVKGWRLLQRELAAPRPKPITLREPHEFSSVRITVGRPLAELNLPLGRLAVLVTTLPAAVWLLAAGIGRWLVGHALLPVRAMADRAHSTTKADFSLRLPVDASGDELSELGEAFNHLLDQLQEAFNRQRRFTGDAAHQLRTPLTVLLGQIDVARRRPRSTAEYQETLDLLAKQTTELAQVVETLLFLARAEDGTSPPNMEPIEIDNWLEAYLTRWEDNPRHNDLTASMNSHALVMATPALLSQVLDNLILNAFNYSDPGTDVSVNTGRFDSHVQISVKDRGIGISAEDRRAIFEPFFRSSIARKNGTAGTGLGLAIAARIADVLGGKVTCESSPGQGSEFSLQLPVLDSASSEPS